MRDIERLKLNGWFECEFTPEEKEIIQNNFDLKIETNSAMGSNFLASCFLPYFSKYDVISRKIIEEVEALLPLEKNSAFDLHYIYDSFILSFYKLKEFESALKYCDLQIENFPSFLKEARNSGFIGDVIPAVNGFEKACIYYKKQKEWQKVIEYASKAIEYGIEPDNYSKRLQEAKEKL